jgi:hypothetical protein
MTCEEIMNSLERLSAYELRRISSLASRLMSDESKLRPIRQALKPGMSVSYFSSHRNDVVDAILTEVRNTTVSLRNKGDGQLWTVPFYSINTENISLSVNTNHKKGTLTKADLGIGDIVGFEHNGQDCMGTVLKLNPKRVKIALKTGETWGVPYSYLFPVMEGACHRQPEYFIGEEDVVEGSFLEIEAN